jgi:hypothetical protein
MSYSDPRSLPEFGLNRTKQPARQRVGEGREMLVRLAGESSPLCCAMSIVHVSVYPTSIKWTWPFTDFQDVREMRACCTLLLTPQLVLHNVEVIP